MAAFRAVGGVFAHIQKNQNIGLCLHGLQDVGAVVSGMERYHIIAHMDAPFFLRAALKCFKRS